MLMVALLALSSSLWTGASPLFCAPILSEPDMLPEDLSALLLCRRRVTTFWYLSSFWRESCIDLALSLALAEDSATAPRIRRSSSVAAGGSGLSAKGGSAESASARRSSAARECLWSPTGSGSSERYCARDGGSVDGAPLGVPAGKLPPEMELPPAAPPPDMPCLLLLLLLLRPASSTPSELRYIKKALGMDSAAARPPAGRGR